MGIVHGVQSAGLVIGGALSGCLPQYGVGRSTQARGRPGGSSPTSRPGPATRPTRAVNSPPVSAPSTGRPLGCSPSCSLLRGTTMRASHSRKHTRCTGCVECGHALSPRLDAVLGGRRRSRMRAEAEPSRRMRPAPSQRPEAPARYSRTAAARSIRLVRTPSAEISKSIRLVTRTSSRPPRAPRPARPRATEAEQPRRGSPGAAAGLDRVAAGGRGHPSG
jgi:hypothetical protein